MLKKFLFALFVFAFLLSPSPVSADDTCCLGHGGDYACNYSTSQLYCQDGSVSSACTCQAAPTPTPTVVPTDTPVPQTPDCPANSSFSTSSNACTCAPGYAVSNNACVTYAQFCQSQYGNNSVYDSESNSCACSSGYVWNSGGTACETLDGVCNDKLGSKSYYNSSNDSCYCYDGYTIQNGQCQPIPPPPATVVPTTSVPIAVPASVPIPTLAGVLVPTHTPTPTKAPEKKSAVKFDLNKKVPGLNAFVAVKKKKEGFFESIITTILDAIKFAFNF